MVVFSNTPFGVWSRSSSKSLSTAAADARWRWLPAISKVFRGLSSSFGASRITSRFLAFSLSPANLHTSHTSSLHFIISSVLHQPLGQCLRLQCMCSMCMRVFVVFRMQNNLHESKLFACFKIIAGFSMCVIMLEGLEITKCAASWWWR